MLINFLFCGTILLEYSNDVVAIVLLFFATIQVSTIKKGKTRGYHELEPATVTQVVVLSQVSLLFPPLLQTTVTYMKQDIVYHYYPQ